VGDGYSCRFFFSITLSPSASQKQADITEDLAVVGDYLNATLDLYLDGELVSDLRISAGLKGQAVTQISISGSGSGSNRQEAMDNALAEMKKLCKVRLFTVCSNISAGLRFGFQSALLAILLLSIERSPPNII